MNAKNPVQIDPFGVSATRTKDTRLTDHGGYLRLTRQPEPPLGGSGSESRPVPPFAVTG
jgi:hypothetical protein